MHMTKISTSDRNNAFHTKPSDIKKDPIRTEPSECMLTGVITEFSDTRIFSPLLQRLSKYVALRGYVFCLDNQISDEFARQGLSVTGSKRKLRYRISVMVLWCAAKPLPSVMVK